MKPRNARVPSRQKMVFGRIGWLEITKGVMSIGNGASACSTDAPSPPPATFNLVTQSAEPLVTQDADNLIWRTKIFTEHL